MERDCRKAREWYEKGGGEPDRLKKERQHANAVGHWMLRVLADAALVGCFFAGISGFSLDGGREDLIGAAYLGAVALMFHALARYMRPKDPKRAPRWLHLLLASLLLILLLGIVSVFLGGGVVDPVDVWIVSWIAALIALAAWRGFRKPKENA